jgi:hypothetical protein
LANDQIRVRPDRHVAEVQRRFKDVGSRVGVRANVRRPE